MIRFISNALRTLSSSPSACAANATVTLTVREMSCEHCTATVRKSLETLPGVAKATVSLEDETAVVSYDDTRVDVPRLIAATTKAGYPSSPKG